ncbi:MAG: hypothetical protein B7Y99_03890 [Caulobacterales bacterium 32-69-10]|nr:MAG: hypothetical protein B7Y99_03890 [Caulobacterales bacterium 32-69-10]
MAKTAVQYKAPAHIARAAEFGQVIDMRTRRPWRPQQTPSWPYLFDLALIFTLVLLGAWLFLKMRGE